jgi:hypothetical protein
MLVQMRLLRGIRSHHLRPEHLVTGRVVGLALLDVAHDLIERQTRGGAGTPDPWLFPRRRGRRRNGSVPPG